MIHAYPPEVIREAEAPFLARGVPLMRRAAHEVAQRARALTCQPYPPTLVLAGGGNNGGDGIWAGAELAARGWPVAIYLAAPNANTDAIAAADTAGATFLTDLDPATLGRYHLWIDALAGIGLRGAARGSLGALLNKLRENAAITTPIILAVDTPSGLSETAHHPALPATATVAMIAPAPAQFTPAGRALVGTLHVAPLDVPLDPARAGAIMIDEDDIAELWPIPRQSDHKYTRGVAQIIAGSTTYPGAALLTTAACVALSPGMVRYRGECRTAVTTYLPEVVTVAGRSQATLIGSGMPTHLAAAQVSELLTGEGIVIADAGALAALPPPPHRAPLVLTPHAGELARLLQITRTEVEADLLAAARRAATTWDAIVVAKGPRTLITAPTGPFYLIQDATAALATAGSGDVLAGAITATLAQFAARGEQGHTLPPLALQVALAVSLHAAAATHAGGYPLQVRELPAALSATLRTLTGRAQRTKRE
ncbi:MAG: bifunctional ADP-dependent NAD(P)H-hydrate dehydratase/NAD(P)H-hydrate epimerase [Bowdeniella nasicola]|nr:bifunctional ADP-dependent NAD(P)H-hydrate dehydratase/NAD(P)H-hydrate epimerase [Bowdeniella nasicola]